MLHSSSKSVVIHEQQQQQQPVAFYTGNCAAIHMATEKGHMFLYMAVVTDVTDGHTTLNFLQKSPQNHINLQRSNQWHKYRTPEQNSVLLFCCKDIEVVGCRLGRIWYIFDFSDEQKEQMKDFTLK